MNHDVHQLKMDDIFYKMVKEYGADLNALYPYDDVFRSIKEADQEEDQFAGRIIDILADPQKAPKKELKDVAKPKSKKARKELDKP